MHSKGFTHIQLDMISHCQRQLNVMAGNLGQILLVMEAEECEKCMHTYPVRESQVHCIFSGYLFIYLNSVVKKS